MTVYNTTIYDYVCRMCNNDYYMVEGMCYPLSSRYDKIVVSEWF